MRQPLIRLLHHLIPLRTRYPTPLILSRHRCHRRCHLLSLAPTLLLIILLVNLEQVGLRILKDLLGFYVKYLVVLLICVSVFLVFFVLGGVLGE